MTIRWTTGFVAAMAVSATVIPRVAMSQGVPEDQGYAKQLSLGTVTLELAPEWQDSVLVVLVRAETRSGQLNSINLREQVRLAADRQVYTAESAGALRGRSAVAWMVFRLPRRPESFAISIRDVPGAEVRILRWPRINLTP